MKRFLTPSRNDSFHTIDNNAKTNSIQKLSGKNIVRDESKEKIADFKAISNQLNKAPGERRSGVKLP